MICCFLKLLFRAIEQLLNATSQKLLRWQASLLGQNPKLGNSLIG